MKKITYFWRARPFQQKVISDGIEYIIDEKLAHKDTMLYIVSISGSAVVASMAYISTNENLAIALILCILTGCISQAIRYFILPKDINKHLHKIEKGE